VAVIGAVVIIVRHARGWGVPGAFLLEMEEREAAQAAKDMVSEGGPVDPEGTTDPEEAPEPEPGPARAKRARAHCARTQTDGVRGWLNAGASCPTSSGRWAARPSWRSTASAAE
jgi:hypothetical protein